VLEAVQVPQLRDGGLPRRALAARGQRPERQVPAVARRQQPRRQPALPHRQRDRRP